MIIEEADERNRVVERKEDMLFDEGAFREAIINAFLHNLWVTGNEPMFAVYEDWIEIWRSMVEKLLFLEKTRLP